MILRYHMESKNGQHFVESDRRENCERMRRTFPDIFGKCRIKNILQAYPSKVPTDKILEHTN